MQLASEKKARAQNQAQDRNGDGVSDLSALDTEAALVDQTLFSQRGSKIQND